MTPCLSLYWDLLHPGLAQPSARVLALAADKRLLEDEPG
jgi:hypothetical protein